MLGFCHVNAMASELKEWNRLPYHILVDICSYLKIHDRNSFARVCKDFNDIVDCKHIWRQFRFCFASPEDARFLQCLEKYGQHMYQIAIELDQSVTGNRENALNLLNTIYSMKELRLKCLSVKFKGENPCFYSGQEFISALVKFLGPSPQGQRKVCALEDLDLSELSVSLDDKFLDVISASNPQLQRLNIQNSKVLVCNISPQSALRLTQSCRHLKDLHLFGHSISDEVLLQFAHTDRVALHHLSIMYCGRGTSTKCIASETWQTLTRQLPHLKVSLLFDHTCPTDCVSEVMKPEIPVCKLVMETYTYIYDEVNQAACCYSHTLQHFVLNTPISRNSAELHSALVRLAAECHLLEEMRVYCVLDAPTVDKILELRPEIKESGRYTLRHEPWLVMSYAAAPVTYVSDVY